jgi:hypothetical protein
LLVIFNERSGYQISRLPNYQILASAVLLVLLAALIVPLAANLRADAFFAGDPGVKLIAARNALEHPSHPFEISLPTIGDDRVPHVDPFFSVHGDHAHAVTSALFPVLTAPLLRLFGLRGLYILPAFGFVMTVAACAAVATSLDAGRQPLVTALVAALATPFLFYGLEFWEHTLALACAAAGTALFLRRRAFWCGLLFGTAVLLRPEAGWFAGSVLVASALRPPAPLLRSWASAGAGAVLVLAPAELYVLSHFGTIMPPHMSANAGTLSQGWMASRVAIASLWFGSGSDASFWRVAPVLIACVGYSLLRRPSHAGHAFLWSVVIVDAVFVLVSAPNDGGAQWGPRYLLFMFLPLTVLAADGVEALPGKSVAAGMLVLALAVGSLWVQRGGYRELRATKTTYGRIVDFVATEVPVNGYLVTDVWWLDQIAAAATANRHFLYAPDAATGASILQRLSDKTVPMVTVVRSASESADTNGWTGKSCYFEEQRDKISDRELVAIRLRHRCS